ncbi:MAG: chloramphenicol acetyltransferase [Firmicutes bacterium]|nr:chloramphenicol acetyltransferase [Bacillota bacterium]
MSEKRLSKKPLIKENCELKNTELGKFTEIGMLNFFENVKFGDYSYTGQFCFIQNAIIGKFSNIAAMVRIGPTDHPMKRPSLHHFTYRRKMYGFDDKDDFEFFEKRKERKTYIGHDTWIGHGAIILPEVKIGNGAVVASGALVTKDVAPYTVVAGIPAKPIKKRFDEDVIKKLEEIKWWNWSYEKIKQNLDDFLLDIELFVKKHY